jgi:hypothetical protein
MNEAKERGKISEFNAPPIDELLGINDIGPVLGREKPSGERIHPNHGS